MIDTSNAKWDLSKEERYAVRWFEKNGFSGKIEKQYITKTIFIVEKDGVKEAFHLTQGLPNMNMKNYMKMFEENWTMLKSVLTYSA